MFWAFKFNIKKPWKAVLPRTCKTGNYHHLLIKREPCKTSPGWVSDSSFLSWAFGPNNLKSRWVHSQVEAGLAASWQPSAPSNKWENKKADPPEPFVISDGRPPLPLCAVTVSIFQRVLSECNSCSIFYSGAAWLASFAFMTVLGYD